LNVPGRCLESNHGTLLEDSSDDVPHSPPHRAGEGTTQPQNVSLRILPKALRRDGETGDIPELFRRTRPAEAHNSIMAVIFDR
jgi:hypothetical protein